jgi:hypothetical protein
MSLRADQQRELDRIGEALRADDRRLESLFTTFSRVTRLEAMPGTEQITPEPRRQLRRLLAAVVGRLPVRRRRQAQRAAAV